MLARASAIRTKTQRLLKYSLGIRPWPDQHEGKPIAVLHLSRTLRFRFFDRIVRVLSASGYEVACYVSSWRDLLNLGRMEGDISWLSGVRIVNTLPRNSARYTLCSDDDRSSLLNRPWARLLMLEFDIGKSRDSVINPIHIPFLVHDYIFRCCLDQRQRLLNNQKNVRLLFSGSWRGYSGGMATSQFGLLDREKIINVFREHPNTTVIRTGEEFEALLRQSSSTRFYMVDTQHYRIPAERWLETLSHVECFLCPPGVMTPMSYNAVEAMALGTIPLINYGKWFHPRLIDREGCITFRTIEDLNARLDELATISSSDLVNIRSGCLSYYETYLRVEAIGQRIADRSEPYLTLVMDVELPEYLRNVRAGSLALAAE